VVGAGAGIATGGVGTAAGGAGIVPGGAGRQLTPLIFVRL